MTLAKFTGHIGIKWCASAGADTKAKGKKITIRSWYMGAGRFSSMPYKRFHRHTFCAIFRDWSDGIWKEGNVQVLFRVWRFGVCVGQKVAE